MRKLQVNEIDLNQVVALSLEQAKTRYNVGQNTIFEIADKANANIRIGKRRLYSREKLDKYFEDLCE